MNITIKFYPDGNDGCVKEYLEQLRLDPQKKASWAQLVQDVAVLQSEGLQSKQISIRSLKSISKGLWEIRRHHNKIYYRMYFVVNKNTFWLVHYLEKKSSTIPRQDVELLRKRAKEII